VGWRRLRCGPRPCFRRRGPPGSLEPGARPRAAPSGWGDAAVHAPLLCISPPLPKKKKKQQREAPFKAPQMYAPVQYTVLTEIPATNPADAHSTKNFGLHQPRPSPGPPSSVSYRQLYNSYHTASSCVPRPRRPARPILRA
jgi:hypothetical protein